MIVFVSRVTELLSTFATFDSKSCNALFHKNLNCKYFLKSKKNIFTFMKPNLTPTELPKYSEKLSSIETLVNVVSANNKVCTKKRCSKYLKLEEIQ